MTIYNDKQKTIRRLFVRVEFIRFLDLVIDWQVKYLFYFSVKIKYADYFHFINISTYSMYFHAM